MYIEQIAEISSALLTPVVAIVATYIAWQQWKTNQQKLVLDRYDRRLRVYEEVRKIIGIILRQGKASYEELLRFWAAVSEADFLYGSEITDYIDEIYKRGVNLQSWTEQYRGSTQEKPEGYDHQKVIEGKHSEFEWFTKQFEPAKQKFKKYLDISNEFSSAPPPKPFADGNHERMPFSRKCP